MLERSLPQDVERPRHQSNKNSNVSSVWNQHFSLGTEVVDGSQQVPQILGGGPRISVRRNGGRAGVEYLINQTNFPDLGVVTDNFLDETPTQSQDGGLDF